MTMDIETAAANLAIIEEHRKGLALLLASLLQVDQKSADLIVSSLIRPTTLYRHIIGQCAAKLPTAIAKANILIDDENLIEDAIIVLNMFKAGTPVCPKCRKLTLGHDGRAWVTRNVGDRCIHCSAVIVWEVFNAKHWSWVTEKDEANSCPRIQINGEDVPSPPQEIENFLNTMGGVHPDIDALLKKHSVGLPHFLLALWKTYAALAFRNERMRVLWAVSRQKHESFEFSQANLDAVVLKAKGVGVKEVIHAPKPMPAQSGGSSLRDRLNATFKIDSAFEAFCIDNFPDVARNFSSGMLTTAKVSLLIQCEDAQDIEAALAPYSARRR